MRNFPDVLAANGAQQLECEPGKDCELLGGKALQYGYFCLHPHLHLACV